MSWREVLERFRGKRVKDFIYTPNGGKFVIVFEDDTSLYFKGPPLAHGVIRP